MFWRSIGIGVSWSSVIFHFWVNLSFNNPYSLSLQPMKSKGKKKKKKKRQFLNKNQKNVVPGGGGSTPDMTSLLAVYLIFHQPQWHTIILWWEVLMSTLACDPLRVCHRSHHELTGGDMKWRWHVLVSAPSPLWFTLGSLTHVIQELLVGEAVRALTCPALLLQEPAPDVPRGVGDAAAPRGLCDP